MISAPIQPCGFNRQSIGAWNYYWSSSRTMDEKGKMNKRVKIMLVVCLVVCAAHASPNRPAVADEILVSPCGLSILDARNRIRAERKDGNDGPRTVRIKAGTYRLEEALMFGPEDSHVTYVADGDVVVTGSRRLNGWTVEPDGSWSAAVDWVKEDRMGGFRLLRVNGVMCPRARLPKRSLFTILNDDLPDGTSWNAHRPSFFYDPKEFNPQWRNLSDAEIVCYHFWTDSHLRIASVNAESNKVTLVTPCKLAFDTGFSNNKSGGLRGLYVVENIPAAMTDPGDWWLEHAARRLHYRPRPGENPATAVVEVPFVRTLVSLEGHPVNDGRYVEGITFRGIRFSMSQYELEPSDTNNGQGASGVAAAVVLAGARNCRFEHCIFEDLSGYAAKVSEGSCDNVFSHCTMTRLGAGGVILDGGSARSERRERASGNVIEDCEIGPYGGDFRSGVGILLKNADHTVLTHNHIFDGYYTGISAGWVWGYAPSASTDNEISYNHIHKIGHGLLSDMGGIYTLGRSEGTKIVGNRIHDVDARAYGGWGIYNDEGSTGILVASNVVYDTKFAPYDIHYAKDIDVRNNIFALGRKEQISRGRVEKHVSVRFVNNIVYWQEGCLYAGNWEDQPSGGRSFIADRNVYFNPKLPKDQVKVYKSLDFASWEKKGHDVSSVYADPLFKDAFGRDFRLSACSPAFTLGFVDFNQENVGIRYTSTGMECK